MIFLRVSGTTGPDPDPKAQMTRRVVISESFFRRDLETMGIQLELVG